MRDTPHPVMLFAAGFGTRMGALTRDRPKPLIEVAGRPLIDHALDLVVEAGLSPVAANLHYHADMLADHLSGRGVLLSVEDPEILETGGGLRAALPLLAERPREAGTVMTLNTDAVWSGPNPLSLLRAAWEPERMDALLVGIPRARALGHDGAGDFTVDDDGTARRGPGLVYGGAQILRTDGLAAVRDRVFSLNVLWDRMIEARRLFVLPYPGRWCDVGTPEGIGLAERLMESRDV